MLFFVVCISACKDQGCIDADDFGEYESQTLIVPSNPNQNNCTYDYGLDVANPAQGKNLQACLTSNTVTVTDEGGNSKTGSNGCNSDNIKSDPKFLDLCIKNCIQTCQTSLASSSGNSEPNWISTDKKSPGINVGVTIWPGAEILINAKGMINLGPEVDYSTFYVQANKYLPHSSDQSGATEIPFDVRQAQSFSIKFSGQWNNGTEQIGGGGDPISSSAAKIINGAKRIVGYLIPNPDGYPLVPLSPITTAWECTYSGSSLTQSSCQNKANGYTGFDSDLSNKAFPISSDYATQILGEYGGFLPNGATTSEYDLKITRSGFIKFAMIGGSGASGSCTIKARIINPDSFTARQMATAGYTGSTYTGAISQFTDQNGSITLTAPTGKIFRNVLFSNYGLPTINDSNYFENTACSGAENPDKTIETACRGQNTCGPFNAANFFDPICISGNTVAGNGGIGKDSTTGGASGGGGGGNNSGNGGAQNATNAAGLNGSSSSSYYDSFFNTNVPTVTTAANAGNFASSGTIGNAGGNGSIKLGGITFATPGPPQSYTVTAADATNGLSYEVIGAGGGSGGNKVDGSTTITGNSGAAGAKVSGTLTGLSAGSVILAYVGGGGGAGGYKNFTCTNISNYATETQGSLTLTAPSGYVFNSVIFASYGLPDFSVTPYAINSSCNSANSVSVVSAACLGKSSCTINVNDAAFSEANFCSSFTTAQEKSLAVTLQYGPADAAIIGVANTTTTILQGGNGGEPKSANSCTTLSGGAGGAGGGASSLVIENNIASSIDKRFLVIAGGGGGGGGAGSVASPPNPASANTSLSKNLSAAAFNKKIAIKIEYISPQLLYSTSSTLDDFYEYDSEADDPVNDLLVNATPSGSAISWSEGTDKIFVRKGQAIRFSPWADTETWKAASGITRKCGTGMAISIDPRPALLCRGKSSSSSIIDNPDCPLLDFNSSGTLIGCKDYFGDCGVSTSNSFCPANCQTTITCTNGTADKYQKTGCTSTNPSSCSFSTETTSYSQTTCDKCNNARKTNAEKAAKTSISDLDLCYDLEDFKGKVSNIPTGTQDQSTIDTFMSSDQGLGIKILSNFNGNYGNLEDFQDSGSKDGSNIIYKTKSPISPSKNGRLKFLMLDGQDFLTAKSSYDNNSGYFKISPSGSLDFNNGQFLEVRLCKETSDTSTVCKGTNPTPIDPSIIKFDSASSSNLTYNLPKNIGNYEFDSDGNIARKTAPLLLDCKLDPHKVEMEKGSNYYCHIQSYGGKLDDDISRYRLTFKIFDPETTTNKYANNSGEYVVKVKVKKASQLASNIIGNVINPVVEEIDGKPLNCKILASDQVNTGSIINNPYYNPNIFGNLNTTCAPGQNIGNQISSCQKQFYCGKSIGQAERVYKMLIGDSSYQRILKMSLVLMFSFYGLGFLMGVSELKHSEIVIRIIKIGVIYFFVGSNGWYWFNEIVVKFFKDGTNYLTFMMASSFDSSTLLKKAISSGNFYDKSVLFTSVDRILNMIFSTAVLNKTSALLFASIFGWAYLIIIYLAFLLYIYAIASAVLLYLVAQVFISILFILGPIFLIFLLFSHTKEMFDNWLKALVGFSLQQIFLLTTVAFFNMLIYQVLKMSLGYKVCWDDVWTINLWITRVTLLSWWNISSLPPRTNSQSDVGNIGNPDGIPSIFSILCIWVLASLMRKFVTFMTDIASAISGGIKASQLGSGIAVAASGLASVASKPARMLVDNTIGKGLRALDDKIFDSGKNADNRRELRKKEIAEAIQFKNEMQKAGNEAISQYKKGNASELASLSKDQQIEKLTSIRNEAMRNKADLMGLSAPKTTELMQDKGLKYQGTNVFGAAISSGIQGLRKNGSLLKSIEDKKVNIAFNSEESKDAMKNMTRAERKEFVESAARGDVKVTRSNKEKALSLARNLAPIETGKEIINDLKNAPKNIQSAYNNATKGEYREAAKDLAKVVMPVGRIVASPLKGIGETTKSIGKGSVNNIAKAAKKVNSLKNSIHDKNYNKAVSQLEEEDKITKMRTGFGWARNDDEKKMIRERMKENLQKENPEQKATDKPDKIAISALINEEKYLAKFEGKVNEEKISLKDEVLKIGRSVFERKELIEEAKKKIDEEKTANKKPGSNSDGDEN